VAPIRLLRLHRRTCQLRALTLSSGSGTIGTSGANILTNAPSLIANTSGNVYVTDSAAVSLAGAFTGAIFSLTDTAGGITINANVAASSITLNANGSGTISQSYGTNLSTSGTADPVLHSGNIGSSNANIVTNAPSLIANTFRQCVRD